MARVGLCLIWCARVLFRCVAVHQWRSLRAALRELRGESTFDQGLSICMAWLTVEVIVIAGDFMAGGIRMLIAKTPRGLKASILEGLTEGFTVEELEAIVAKKRQAWQEKTAKRNGKKG